MMSRRNIFLVFFSNLLECREFTAARRRWCKWFSREYYFRPFDLILYMYIGMKSLRCLPNRFVLYIILSFLYYNNLKQKNKISTKKSQVFYRSRLNKIIQDINWISLVQVWHLMNNINSVKLMELKKTSSNVQNVIS